MADFHQTLEGSITPLPESIIVHKLESTEERIRKGIIIPGDDAQGRGIRPRWAQVYAVGDEVSDVSVGEWILMEHGRWTRGIKLKNDKEETTIRMVDKDCILGSQDEEPLDPETFGTAIHVNLKSLYE